ncbi:Sister chromatid cohesion 1 protein 2 [Morella rubra]|uniref:Sister chromatid cohesion 1 protein 2 n=1 Tax=Morella rubra TaxID=262757 RepID=A0A6A1VIN1_9ROSI|nr:Sister chromatid cohesion 1 protein 2 [Morella rubra]
MKSFCSIRSAEQFSCLSKLFFSITRRQISFPAKVSYCQAKFADSETDVSSSLKVVPPTLLAAEKEEAKAVLTLFLKKNGLSNAVAARTINKSELFIDHLVSRLHSVHKSRYLVGRELTTLEIRDALSPYLEALHEQHGNFIVDVVEKFPNPPVKDKTVLPVSGPNPTLVSKKLKATSRVSEMDPTGKLRPHIRYLIELGMDLEQIMGITRRRPAFAYYSLEGKIKPVVEFLLDLGIPKSDIPTIINKSPPLCGRSLSENLIPSMTFLEDLGVDKKQWAKVIHRFPPLLTYSKQKVKTTIEFLYEMGLSAESIGKILTRCPSIISHSVENKLRPTAKYFQSFGVDVSVLLHRCPQTFGLSIEGNLKPVTEFFLERGYSIDEIGTMISRHGALYSFSLSGNMIPKWEFFLTMDYPNSELVKFPQYFGYSLEERIKPRIRVAAVMTSDQTMYKETSMQIYVSTNAIFEGRSLSAVYQILDDVSGGNVVSREEITLARCCIMHGEISKWGGSRSAIRESRLPQLAAEILSVPYFSITLPEKFELDAFDLEILDDVSGGNVVSREEITLKDVVHGEISKWGGSRRQISFPAKVSYCQAKFADSETDVSSSLKMVPPTLLAAEKEEAKAVLTLFLKKNGLSNAVAARTINKSDLFIDHLLSRLHSIHKSRYLVGRELTTLEIRDALSPYLEALLEEHGNFIVDVVEKFPNPPVKDKTVLPVSGPNPTLDSKKLKAMSRVSEMDPTGKLRPHIHYLIELGMDLEQIMGITRRFPAFAYYSLEGKIKPVVEFLLDLGIPKSDIPTIINKRPQLCGISLSENLIPTMAFLEDLGVDKKQWAKVIHRFPPLLTYSKQKVKTTIEFLYEMGLSAESIGKILTRSPNIISYSVEDKLRPTAKYFQSLGVDVSVLLHRCPQTFGLSIEAVMTSDQTMYKEMSMQIYVGTNAIFEGRSLSAVYQDIAAGRALSR